MSKFIGIDYGQKKIGLSVTDDDKVFAFPLETVKRNDFFDFITNFFKENDVEKFVIGKPTRMSGESSEIEGEIIEFIKKLERKFPNIPIVRFDERFTSKIATKSILSAGAKKKMRLNKEIVDKISATIILRDFLEYITKNS
jgi:putative Holliday junction resolvase|tara:strand:+ start:2673 stop:3095 length:423 start_codon:yes stop_codon:yes gene_type:complete